MSYYEIPLTTTPFDQRTFKLTLDGERNINILLSCAIMICTSCGWLMSATIAQAKS